MHNHRPWILKSSCSTVLAFDKLDVSEFPDPVVHKRQSKINIVGRK